MVNINVLAKYKHITNIKQSSRVQANIIYTFVDLFIKLYVY